MDRGAVRLQALGGAVEVVLGEEVGGHLGVGDRQLVVDLDLGVDLHLVAEEVLRVAQVLDQEGRHLADGVEQPGVDRAPGGGQGLGRFHRVEGDGAGAGVDHRLDGVALVGDPVDVVRLGKLPV